MGCRICILRGIIGGKKTNHSCNYQMCPFHRKWTTWVGSWTVSGCIPLNDNTTTHIHTQTQPKIPTGPGWFKIPVVRAFLREPWDEYVQLGFIHHLTVCVQVRRWCLQHQKPDKALLIPTPFPCQHIPFYIISWHINYPLAHLSHNMGEGSTSSTKICLSLLKPQLKSLPTFYGLFLPPRPCR